MRGSELVEDAAARVIHYHAISKMSWVGENTSVAYFAVPITPRHNET